MRLRQRRSTTISVFTLACAAIIAVGIFVANNATRSAYADGDAGRLITVYDRGEQTVFLSDANTVGDALTQQGYTFDERDAVEPALNEKLVAKDYRVNIYRARPITVIDGALRHRVMTPYQTTERIAADAGIELYPEDVASLDRSDDLLTDGAGLQLTIKRATPLTLDLFGKQLAIRTQAKTVGDLLKEKRITLGGDDHVLPAVSEQITRGLVVQVWREGTQTITVDEDIDFAVEHIEDADRSIGYKSVKTAGIKGKRSVTYEVEIRNGKEVARKEIASIAITQPVKQVEIVGIKGGATTTPTENEAIAWRFFISQGFTAEQTAGIMGNLAQEHGFKTSNVPGGLGIAQWLGARKAKLLAREDPFNIHVQLQFIMHEFNTTESRAYRAVRNAQTVSEATIAFQNLYERCGMCKQERRIQFAYSILDRYRP